jgi:P2-related tail formation protein
VLVLPALAWSLSRTAWRDATKQRIVRAAVGGYAAAVLGAVVWAALTW